MWDFDHDGIRVDSRKSGCRGVREVVFWVAFEVRETIGVKYQANTRSRCASYQHPETTKDGWIKACILSHFLN